MASRWVFHPRSAAPRSKAAWHTFLQTFVTFRSGAWTPRSLGSVGTSKSSPLSGGTSGLFGTSLSEFLAKRLVGMTNMFPSCFFRETDSDTLETVCRKIYFKFFSSSRTPKETQNKDCKWGCPLSEFHPSLHAALRKGFLPKIQKIPVLHKLHTLRQLLPAILAQHQPSTTQMIKNRIVWFSLPHMVLPTLVGKFKLQLIICKPPEFLSSKAISAGFPMKLFETSPNVTKLSTGSSKQNLSKSLNGALFTILSNIPQ